ncbi:MAG: hypothetical protein V2B19_15320 [Pseudomonadota bacterium]
MAALNMDKSKKDALNFEPVALRLRVTRAENEPVDVFNAKVLGLIDGLATRCLSEKDAVIGHIKGFAAGPEGSYLRVSALGDGRPVDIEGHIAGEPASIFLTLNIHVFRISADRINALLIESINEAKLLGNSEIFIVNPLPFVHSR